MQTVRVSEMFLSLQGESTRAGLPCAFVRLAGCNLRCRWCDTARTWDGENGREMELADVLQAVTELGCPRVEVTGGEPMMQAATPELLARLCDAGLETLLETNGSVELSRVDGRVVKIVDVKCPSSGEAGSFLEANLAWLSERDEVKFVLADRADFDYARDALNRWPGLSRGAVILSPVLDRLNPAELAAWILDARIDVRLGVQLHKMIGVP